MRSLLALIALAGGCSFAVVGSHASDGGGDAGEGLRPPARDLADPCASSVTATAGQLAVACARDRPPVIDGDLADWPAALFTSLTHDNAGKASGSWSGNSDADNANSSAQYALRWDDANFYLAAHVFDDHRDLGGNSAFDDDSIELYLDGDGVLVPAYGPDDMHFLVRANCQSPVSYNPPGFQPGIQIRCRDTGTSNGNWDIEVAVPWSLLRMTAPAFGQLIGFDLQINDNDGGPHRDRTLIRSISAMKHDGCADLEPHCDATAFATVALVGR